MQVLDIIVPFAAVLIFCVWQIWLTQKRKK